MNRQTYIVFQRGFLLSGVRKIVSVIRDENKIEKGNSVFVGKRKFKI